VDYVWIAYLTQLWGTRRDARHLATALTVWASGLCHFMAIAPAVLSVIAAWVWHRPPLRLKPLMVGGFVVALVWFPYLKFEAGRGFVDLGSQVLRRSLLPENFRDTWCNPHAVLRGPTDGLDQPASERPAGTSALPAPAWRSALSRRLGQVEARGRVTRDGLLVNFEVASSPVSWAAVGLLLTVLGGAIALTRTTLHRAWTRHAHGWRRCLTACGIAAILAGVLVNEFVVRRYLSSDGVLERPTVWAVRLWRAISMSGGLLLLMRGVLKRTVTVGRPLVVGPTRPCW
jgi:hypothetical protein